MTRILTSLLAVASSLVAPSLAGTLFVDANLTTGANDGSSWADAFQGEGGLDAALIARTPADDIWVAQGRYRPSVDLVDGRHSYRVSGRLDLFGGFSGGESTLGERPPRGVAETVLDGDLLGDDLAPGGTKDDNSRHVMLMDGVYGTIDGITVEGGYAWSLTPTHGGAMFFLGNSPSDMSLRHCTFRGNEASFTGGAINMATANSSLSLFDCRFLHNRVGTYGGALSVNANPRVHMDSCEFSGNVAGNGGALFLRQVVDNRIRNCAFYDNEARAPFGGGAMFVFTDGALQIESTTVVDNVALANDQGGLLITAQSFEMTNSILWGNVGVGGASGELNQTNVTSGVSYSIVQGWASGGVGNLSVDPLLTDAANGDFEPLSGSPAIDAGGPSLSSGALISDLRLNRRRVDDPLAIDTGVGPAPVIDIGAVERSVGAIGHAVCATDPNSTGLPGQLDAFGSTVAADNMVVLVATNLPPNQFGIFVVSRDTGFIPGPGGPILCLAGVIRRLVGPGQILGSGAAGEFSLALDLTMMPAMSGFEPVLAGQSWSFQCWHRDVGPSYFYGFTDATTVNFQ